MIYELPLSGLRCHRCIQKLEQALSQQDNISHYTVTKTDLQVTGEISRTSLIALIQAQGFDVPDSITLALSGLSCGRCVNKVKAALENAPNVDDYHVEKTFMRVTGSITAAELTQLIEELGYAVVLDTPPTASKSIHHEHNTPDLTPPNNAEAPAATEQQQNTAKGQRWQIIIHGMTCASCVASVEKTIRAQPDTTEVSVNLAESSATVYANDPEPIITALNHAGYPASLMVSEQQRRETLEQQSQQRYRRHLRDTAIALTLSLPMMGYGMFGGSMMITSSELQIGWGLVGILTLFMLATAGRDFFRNAITALSHKRATMDTLVALGTGCAWLYSMLVVVQPSLFPESARHVYFEASAMIIGLISLGHAIETKARRRSSKALEKLLDLQPLQAITIVDGAEKSIDIDQITPGMQLRLKPGAKVALDGVVTHGHSFIDESLLTGEPIAVNKQTGDTVHAGTLNQQGTLDYTVTATGNDTLLARIIDMVRQAQSSKPAIARLADRIAAVFVPIVVIIALCTALLWWLLGPEPKVSYMLVAATSVLIIACPCALGLATPMSVTIGVGRAAEFGVLIRDANALQLANSVDTVVLDKTGTLTQGAPQITSVALLKQEHSLSQQDVLDIVASIECYSEHPLAIALSQAGHSVHNVDQFIAHLGKGVAAYVNNQQWFIGNQRLMEEQGIAYPAESAAKLAASGATAVFVACNDQAIALLGISDPLREDSQAAVSAFQRMGKQVIMLTGDHHITAKAIAQQAGITEVIANVLPDGKAAAIQQLTEQGRSVLMIGDGINDAPALAAAHVGMAMGSGSDVAKETAHFTLVRHSLGSAVDALQLSNATLRNMYQNLFGAFIYNIIGIPVAAGILYPFTGTLLNPMLAGAAMALSSITVVSNANRLRLFQPKA
ncbi:copper-translocating P-type ATPase [Thaumasiovibrio sp. DFM-14]|uniref:copper-translocating P-type ATPase n=1 Tax=Thaumasiovibrio sp. DFM-14 TaxID=3384792 RepID=UPI00399FB0F8